MTATVIFAGGLFVVNNALAVYLAVSIAGLMAGGEDRLRRAVLTLANFGLIVFAVQLLIGSFGLLTPIGSLVVLVVLNAGFFFFRGSRSAKGEQPATDKGKNPPENVWSRLSLVLLSGALAVWFVYAVVLGTKHGFDDLVYHTTIVAGWLVDQRITLDPFTYQAYYPLNAEVLSSWFMLPYHTDAYASITALYWALLSALSIVSIVYSRTGSMERARLAAALFVCATGVHALDAYQGIIRSFAAVDLAGPAMLLAAVAVMSRPSSERAAPGVGEVFYLGLLAGFAVGVKVSFAPAALVLMVWVLALRYRRMSPSAAGSGLLVFAAGLLLTGIYWYARNLIVTGNPLFPAEFGPFGGPFGKVEQLRTTMMHWIRQSPTDGEQWGYILGKLFNWPWQLGILAFAGYVVALFRIFRPGASETFRGARPVAVILATIGIALLLTHPFAPFSGTINRPQVNLRVDLRFLIFSFAAGMILLSMFFSTRGRVNRVWTVLAAAGVVSTMLFAGRSGLYFLIGAAVATLCLFLWPMVRDRFTFRRSGELVSVVILVLLAVWYPEKYVRTSVELYTDAPKQNYVARLEKLPDGSRLAMFTHLPTEYSWYYKLYGRRLQHVPVPLNENGAPYVPLHVAWPDRFNSWWGVWKTNTRAVNQARFYQNIKRAGVQYVIVTRPERRNWPIYYQFMSRPNVAEKIFEDECSAMWKLK